MEVDIETKMSFGTFPLSLTNTWYLHLNVPFSFNPQAHSRKKKLRMTFTHHAGSAPVCTLVFFVFAVPLALFTQL